jgi:hypothetical protein
MAGIAGIGGKQDRVSEGKLGEAAEEKTSAMGSESRGNMMDSSSDNMGMSGLISMSGGKGDISKMSRRVGTGKGMSYEAEGTQAAWLGSRDSRGSDSGDRGVGMGSKSRVRGKGMAGKVLRVLGTGDNCGSDSGKGSGKGLADRGDAWAKGLGGKGGAGAGLVRRGSTEG